MKTLKKFRFFFRLQLTLTDFNQEQQKQIKELCANVGTSAQNVVFKRTFNNCQNSPGQKRRFQFIGFYPVFIAPALAFSYFSESNEID